MIWKVGGKIRRLPTSIETPYLESYKTLHCLGVVVIVAIVKLFKHDAIEAYLIWSCAM